MKIKGFTLLEVLIVVSILAVITAVGGLEMGRSREEATLKTAAEQFSQTIKETQNRAQTAQGGQGWGLRCSGHVWQRFSYDSNGQDSSLAQFDFSNNITCVSTAAEVRFEKLSGLPQTPVDFTLTLGTSRRISVRSPGTIELTSL